MDKAKQRGGWKLGPRSEEYRKKLGDANRTHGKYKTYEYKTWCGIIQRCCDENSKDFYKYGGRGITVCESWKSFEGFYKDMGDRPIGMSIDRINNDGNYEPSNCRWATKKEQANNRRTNKIVIYCGFAYTATKLAELFGIPPRKFQQRIRRGMPVEEAIKPIPFL